MVLFHVRRERLAGILLGTAVGDALGLPFEGMSTRAISRRAPSLARFELFGSTGYVSDDTEQSALVAQSLARSGGLDVAAFVRCMRLALLGWFVRLPWGIGLGTLRACLRLMLGMKRSGVRSAGNGAAMRAAICGGYLADRPREERVRMVDALSEITHTDPRAVQGGRFIAELAAICVQSARIEDVDVERALAVVDEPELVAALDRARSLAASGATIEEAATTIGNTGYVVHSVPLALFCFARFVDPATAIASAVRAGGDTDTNAAIVGALIGALHGEDGLPQPLVSNLAKGPFGATHLRQLASDLAETPPTQTASYAWSVALVRNLALYPVVLAHALVVLASRAR